MPIRINLLAEAQAAEEDRRRDPVKRAMWAVGFVIAVVLGFSGYLQTKVMSKQGVLNLVKADMKRLEKDYKEVMENAKKYAEIQGRLTELQRLNTNRFLWANVLNELQNIHVPGVQLGRIKSLNEYALIEGIPAKTNSLNVVQRARPAKSREHIVLTLEARDYGSGNYRKFVEAMDASPFFKASLSRTNTITMKQMLENQTDISDTGRSFSLFVLDCSFQEKELEEKSR